MKHSLVLYSSVIILALLCASADAETGSWAQWRGPDRDGHSSDKGLLKEWPAGGPKLVWKATGLGLGYATVSLAGDRLYTMGDKQDANYLLALNAENGQPVWSARVGKTGAPGWGGFAGPRAAPTIDGDRVFAVGQYGELVCADAATGREIWRKHYVDDLGGELPEWGFSGMPLVDGDQVVVAPGGKRGNLAALNKKTGELIWQSTELTDGIHYSSPMQVEIGGVRQYVQLTDAHVAGIAAKDGQVLWRAERIGKTAVIPTPIYHEGYVYVTSGYGLVVLHKPVGQIFFRSRPKGVPCVGQIVAALQSNP
jgi:outer membrane protein assembly factor BamB